MGYLFEGKWIDKKIGSQNRKGEFVRQDAQFRNWITADGSPGASGDGGFEAEPDRYHLYFSHACPWAHRTLIFRTLKGLEKIISISDVHWFYGKNGWTFENTEITDSANNANHLHEIYTASETKYTGVVSVPVLWDKSKKVIVSNESSEIIRMFNSSFDHIGARRGDYYPKNLKNEIDAINDRIYSTLNNGVYRTGFSTTQDAYERAVTTLFDTLDWLEERLKNQRYLLGNDLTEADWRLFTTLVRFDCVYVGHFKCNIRRIADYKNLSDYMKNLYKEPGISKTVRFDHIKNHYYASHKEINPTQIIPVGPDIEF